MTSQKFHLTPKGQARPCSATIQCRYTEDGVVPEHYDTKEEAQAAYEKIAAKEHGGTKGLTKKAKENTLSSNESIAADYYDENLSRFSQGFPKEVIESQKERYIQDALNNPEALSQLKKWNNDKVEAGKFFDNNQRNYYKGFPEEVIQSHKEEYIREVLNNDIAKDSLSNNNVVEKYDEKGNSVYQGVNHIEDSVVYDGVRFQRLTKDTIAGEPYSFRVQVGKELTDKEAQKISQLFGYEYAKTGGERGNPFEQDSPNSIVIYADTTKGRAYRRLEDFVESLPDVLEQGTPVRKTDKAGEGTKGTRLVDGMKDLGYVALYADHVYEY